MESPKATKDIGLQQTTEHRLVLGISTDWEIRLDNDFSKLTRHYQK